MANAVQIKMVQDWNKEMELSLSSALSATHEIGRRSLAEACKHALILMARSARTMTKQARKNRKIMRDKHGQYYEFFSAKGKTSKAYKWSFDDAKMWRHIKTWEQARIIPRRGIAKRSWFWGMDFFRRNTESKPMRKTTNVTEYLTKDAGGYILTDRLPYLQKILPTGWEADVERRGVAQIMRQAQNRLKGWQTKAEKAFATKHGPIEQDTMAKYLIQAKQS